MPSDLMNPATGEAYNGRNGKQRGGMLTDPRRSVCGPSISLIEAGLPVATPGETLRWKRNVVRLSQKPMAAKAGIADGRLSELENGLLQAKLEEIALVDAAAFLEMADLLEGFSALIREIYRGAKAA